MSRLAARVSAGDADFLALCALLVLVALGGGSAFADTLSLIYVRLAAVAALAVFALTPNASGWRPYRVPLVLLAALAVLMIAQLVPLPPSVWTALPGRAPYLEAAAAAGVPQPWRPLSLTPDLTVNSLASLVVPGAVLVGLAKLDTPRRDKLLLGFLILCAASIVVGILQLGSGDQSPLYGYKRTYPGTPVGLLANRNHQAALLAAFFPALRVWTLWPASDRRLARRRSWLALAGGVVTVPVLLATGSRAGIVLALASLAVTLVLFPFDAPRRAAAGTAGRTWRDRLLRAGLPVLLAAVALATWQFGRALSIQRLTGEAPAVEDDLRFRLAPLVVRIVRNSFPVGTGFGSFDPVFRQYETDAVLIDTFFNHAHNELLEVALTAGLPGLALLAAFLAWWAVRVARALRTRPRTRTARLVLLGGTVVGVLLAASTVDYPLRTPLLEAWFAVACGWLCAREGERDGGRAGPAA